MEASVVQQELRERMQARCDAYADGDRQRDSVRIAEHVLALPQVTQATCVALYAATADEVSCEPLWSELRAAGKRVVMPRVVDASRAAMAFAEVGSAADLESGYAGVLQPQAECPVMDAGEISCVCVPGRVFDRLGNRVGRGVGYYDRWLAEYTGLRIGLGYDWQVLQEPLPSNSWDQQLHMLATPSGCIDCGGQQGATL